MADAAVLEKDTEQIDVLNEFNNTVQSAAGPRRPRRPGPVAEPVAEALDAGGYDDLLSTPDEIKDTNKNAGNEKEEIGNGDTGLSNSDVSGMLSLWTDDGKSMSHDNGNGNNNNNGNNNGNDNGNDNGNNNNGNNNGNNNNGQPQADMGALTNLGELFNINKPNNETKTESESEKYERLRQEYQANNNINEETTEGAKTTRRKIKPKYAKPILAGLGKNKPTTNRKRPFIPAPKMPGGGKPKVSTRSRRK